MSEGKFKKGDLVTMMQPYDSKGAIRVTDYVVSSWGAKQATLVTLDGRNAKFRVYVGPTYELMQGVHSHARFVLTSEYSDAIALAFAEECIADEHKRAKARYERNISANWYPEHESRLYAKHQATVFEAKVVRS